MKPTIRAALNGVIYCTLHNPDESISQYGSDGVIKVYQDTEEDGSFSTGTGTATLAAETTGYTVRDADATTSLYYKARVEDSGGSNTGEWSDVLQYGKQTAYCLALDVRGELATGSGAFDTSNLWDHVLWEMALEASSLIDEYKGVEENAYLASGSATRYVNGNDRVRLNLPWPAVSISEVAVEETDGTYTTWTQGTDYYRWPYQDDSGLSNNPIYRLDVNEKSDGGKSVWISGLKRVKITAVWGVSATPPSLIARACKQQVAQWYGLAQAGWSDIVGAPEFGTLEFPRKLDDAVMKLVDMAPPRWARL